MDNVITRQEHDEFAKRMDEENKRQNKRIDLLEDNMRQIHALTTSVEKMAVSMENMLAELKEQGQRLEKLEKEPLETNKQVKNAVITAIVSAVVGAAVTAILMIM